MSSTLVTNAGDFGLTCYLNQFVTSPSSYILERLVNAGDTLAGGLISYARLVVYKTRSCRPPGLSTLSPNLLRLAYMLPFSTSESFSVFYSVSAAPWGFLSLRSLKPGFSLFRKNALKTKGPRNSCRGQEDLHSLYKAKISTMGYYILSHRRLRIANALFTIIAPVTLPNWYVFACQIGKTETETYMIQQ